MSFGTRRRECACCRRRGDHRAWTFLEQGYSFTTLLAVAAAAIGLTGLFYFQTFRHLKPRQWQALLLLRSMAIVLIVLLLFKPVLSYHVDEENGRR